MTFYCSESFFYEMIEKYSQYKIFPTRIFFRASHVLDICFFETVESARISKLINFISFFRDFEKGFFIWKISKSGKETLSQNFYFIRMSTPQSTKGKEFDHYLHVPERALPLFLSSKVAFSFVN